MSNPDRSASLAHTDRARIVFAPGFWPTAAQQRPDAIEAFTARYEVGPHEARQRISAG